MSIDPVVTDANTGGSFNRYAYANNNPYKYIDPDGRRASRLILQRPPVGIPGRVPSGSNSQLPSFPVMHPVGSLVTMVQIVQGILTTENTQPQSPVINPADVAGKTPAEIGQVATDAGLLPKGPDPLGGKGSFNDPVTGEQRVLVHGDHAHVNDPEGNRVDINGNKVDPKSPEAHLPIKPELSQ